MPTTPRKPTRPNKWIAALLGLLLQPVGLLYVARPGAAAVYLALILANGAARIAFSDWYWLGLAVGLLLALSAAIQSHGLAADWHDGTPRPRYSRWPCITAVVLGCVIAAVGIRAFLYEPFRAPSSSMSPTVMAASSVIVQKWGHGNHGAYGVTLLQKPATATVQRGDILVFESPERRSSHFVKRVVGLPGDKVVYRGKQLFINGVAVERKRAGDRHDGSDGPGHGPAFTETLSGTTYTVLADPDRPEPVASTSSPTPVKNRCVTTAEGLACDVPAGHYFMMGDNRDNSNDSRYWGFLPADHIVGKVVFIGS